MSFRNPVILMPEVRPPGERQLRLQGEKTLDGGFRLILLSGAKRETIDLTPDQTVTVATGMLRAMGIEINFAGVPSA